MMQLIPLHEWKETLILADLPAEDVQRLHALAAMGRLEVDELKTGVRVRAKQWVGVVRVGRIRIRISPKLAGGALNVLRMAGYASGIAALERIPTNRHDLAKGEDLLDLVGLLLADASEQVLRQGLHADYVEEEEDLRFVRGRILVEPYAVQRLRQPALVACRFDEHTTNVLENRILAAALRVALRRVDDAAVRKRIRTVLPAFEEACGGPASVEPGDLDVAYNRLNAHYREAHLLARLMLGGEGVAEEGGLHVDSHAFLIDMNTLFERFLRRYVEDVVAPHGRVEYQHSDANVIRDATTGAPFSRIQPDLVLAPKSDATTRIPLDAKYKIDVAQSDIYQAFIYSVAVSRPHQRAVLVYPVAGGDEPLQRLHIRTHFGRASVDCYGINLPRAIEEAVGRTTGRHATPLKAMLRAFVRPVARQEVAVA